MEEIKKPVEETEEFIVVSDGYKRVPIRNELGEKVGEFVYNPTDVNIVNRYNEVVSKIEEITSPIEKIEMNDDGTGSDDHAIAVLNEAENRMIALLDYMLGGDSRKAFFERTHAFSPVAGQFYCERVIEAVGNYISKKFETEINAMSKNINKHTHGYRTGKHRKGDR